MDPTDFGIQVILTTIIVAPFLWLSGRTIVGGAKAKLMDAVWIVLLGIIIGTAIGFFIDNIIIGFVIQLIIWLALVKHFFDCGWLSALVITIFAVIIAVIVAFILAAVLGLAILTLAV
ncbi:MAG: hypothetical protein JSV35_00405 [Candidatus Bathyarchaeota archaeon]|nr:MAG: hypothetical protein JSV35_00405 [Candidatus Bathyarchaeota archaeon]